MGQHSLTFRINGHDRQARVASNTLLVDLLRRDFGLTGTHVGCDTTQCGCCTVHVDGEAVKSCTMLAVQAAGREITTIEGLSGPDGPLHPVQEAMRARHGLQCGFCTPGIVMLLADFLARHPAADEKAIREALDGNLCRCTGYQHIVDAALAVLQPSDRGGADV
ncbi:(2Fe-2S)-binding protein [Frigidibacter sp. SD6-1]|uniref:(2Fe-2S)-binding protein n=1 Tax=Frigidibacter sp. SD6-1 TaxID=3032581 RepID=UPI0024DFC6A0|nr:(2Fe-2S)-binding protein [Frigidibacter sp. SD6-1]